MAYKLKTDTITGRTECQSAYEFACKFFWGNEGERQRGKNRDIVHKPT